MDFDWWIRDRRLRLYRDVLRPLSEREKALCDFLLAEPFLGRSEIRQQLATTFVAGHCVPPRYVGVETDPDLPRTPPDANWLIPVQGVGCDDDGEQLMVSLVKSLDGRICAIDIRRADGDAPQSDPDPQTLQRTIHERRHPRSIELINRPPDLDQSQSFTTFITSNQRRFRPLNDREHALIAALLREPFWCRDELIHQLRHAYVMQDASYFPKFIRLAVDPEAAPIPRDPSDAGGCPVYADCYDPDGMTINVSLHVNKYGYAIWLDIIRLDGDSPQIYPRPESLVIATEV